MRKPRITIDSIYKDSYEGKVLKDSWIDLGESYNEEYGVGNIVARKYGDDWMYVFIGWGYHMAHIEMILKNGEKYA